MSQLPAPPTALAADEVQFLSTCLAEPAEGGYPPRLKQWLVAHPARAPAAMAALRDLIVRGEAPNRFAVLCLCSDILLQETGSSALSLRRCIYDVLPDMFRAAIPAENGTRLLQLLLVWWQRLPDVAPALLRSLAAVVVSRHRHLAQDPAAVYLLYSDLSASAIVRGPLNGLGPGAPQPLALPFCAGGSPLALATALSP
eukprot:EG_transcript_28370